MPRYEIAFAGQLAPGAQLDAVKANLAKLFQADATRIALLFSGRRMVIKNNLDEAGAEKYRSILLRAGALVEVRSILRPSPSLILCLRRVRSRWVAGGSRCCLGMNTWRRFLTLMHRTLPLRH